MEEVQVCLENKGYSIYIGEKLLLKPQAFLGDHCKWIIITDSNIEKIYGDKIGQILDYLKPYKFIIPPGEESKNPNTMVNILSEMARLQFTRQDKIIAFGGGVVGDLAGFCASTYMRGIDFIQIPTTLLAQVDSSVGGKTGVNLPEGKNIMGAFYQPQLVLIDTALLKTLHCREVFSGLGEVIKYGIIHDYNFFKYIKDNLTQVVNLSQEIMAYIIKRCCEIKAEIVSADEREKGIRKHLNLGHTIGHALETITNYSKYTHGEAVLIGMYYESIMARKMGMLENSYFEEITALIQGTGICLDINEFDQKELITIMGRDKKNTNNMVSFILPVGQGKVEEFLLTADKIEEVIYGDCLYE